MGGFLVVQMLGFTLAVAVFIDATVVRMVVGPALLQLAGDWNWWPFGLHGATVRSEKEQANTPNSPVTARGIFQ
jgi:putative drug exporter of the RND superfamily